MRASKWCQFSVFGQLFIKFNISHFSFADSLSQCAAVLCIAWAVPPDADELPDGFFLHFPSPQMVLSMLQERHGHQKHKNSCSVKIGRWKVEILSTKQYWIERNRLLIKQENNSSSILTHAWLTMSFLGIGTDNWFHFLKIQQLNGSVTKWYIHRLHFIDLFNAIDRIESNYS